MKKLLILSAAAIVLFTTSCKKDNETCTLSSSSITGAYKIASVLYKADAQTPAVDIITTYDACEKDDILTFSSNGTWTQSEGATSCSPSNSGNGNWSLVGETLSLDGVSTTVSNFSCSEFTINITGPGVGETTTTRLVRQ